MQSVTQNTTSDSKPASMAELMSAFPVASTSRRPKKHGCGRARNWKKGSKPASDSKPERNDDVTKEVTPQIDRPLVPSTTAAPKPKGEKPARRIGKHPRRYMITTLTDEQLQELEAVKADPLFGELFIGAQQRLNNAKPWEVAETLPHVLKQLRRMRARDETHLLSVHPLRKRITEMTPELEARRQAAIEHSLFDNLSFGARQRMANAKPWEVADSMRRIEHELERLRLEAMDPRERYAPQAKAILSLPANQVFSAIECIVSSGGPEALQFQKALAHPLTETLPSQVRAALNAREKWALAKFVEAFLTALGHEYHMKVPQEMRWPIMRVFLPSVKAAHTSANRPVPVVKTNRKGRRQPAPSSATVVPTKVPSAAERKAARQQAMAATGR